MPPTAIVPLSKAHTPQTVPVNYQCHKPALHGNKGGEGKHGVCQCHLSVRKLWLAKRERQLQCLLLLPLGASRLRALSVCRPVPPSPPYTYAGTRRLRDAGVQHATRLTPPTYCTHTHTHTHVFHKSNRTRQGELLVASHAYLTQTYPDTNLIM